MRSALPGLAAWPGAIGDPHVRNRGTIGGSIANNDPAADYPAAVLALGATIITSKRDIAADDFFNGLFTTALGEDEIITALSLPDWGPNSLTPSLPIRHPGTRWSAWPWRSVGPRSGSP